MPQIGMLQVLVTLWCAGHISTIESRSFWLFTVCLLVPCWTVSKLLDWSLLH